MKTKINLKPMKYQAKRIREVLAHDVINGIEFYIINYGTHPCAYIHIPETHSLSGFNWTNELDNLITCHGGVTWFDSFLPNNINSTNGKWLGWDYGHCTDYQVYSDKYVNDGRVWTTEDILEEVQNVIAQII